MQSAEKKLFDFRSKNDFDKKRISNKSLNFLA